MLAGEGPGASEGPGLEPKFSLGFSASISFCLFLRPFSTAWILPSTSSRLGVHVRAPTFSAAVPRILTASSSLSVSRLVHH